MSTTSTSFPSSVQDQQRYTSCFPPCKLNGRSASMVQLGQTADCSDELAKLRLALIKPSYHRSALMIYHACSYRSVHRLSRAAL